MFWDADKVAEPIAYKLMAATIMHALDGTIGLLPVAVRALNRGPLRYPRTL